MNPLTRQLEREQARLHALDATTLRRIENSYSDVLTRLRTDLQQVTNRIETARAAGETVNVSWLRRQERYAALTDQMERRLNRFYHSANGAIEQAKKDALKLAREAAPDLTVTAIGAGPAGAEAIIRGGFNQMNTGALDAMVLGRARDGSPLMDLLGKATPTATDKVKTALEYGVAAGKNPRVIAAEIARVSEIPLTRAKLIARTEVVGSYRDATTDAFKNSPVVNRWIWKSAQDPRVCPVCWAMDGQEFPDTESLASHPACRCVQVPRTDTWEDLGFEGMPDSRPPLGPSGPERFDTLTEAEQRQILGPGKWQAWKDGEFQLSDLVASTNHPRWGAGRRMRSLKEVRAGKGPAALSGGSGKGGSPPRPPVTKDNWPNGARGGDEAAKAWRDTVNSVSNELTDRVDDYVGDWYAQVNRYLAYGERPDDLDRVQSIIKGMDAAIRRQGATDRATILHRGERQGRMTEVWRNAEEGDVIQPKRYFSTSTSSVVTEGYSGPVQLEIFAPKGARGLNAKEISRLEHAIQEDEITLPRDSLFKVISKEQHGQTLFVRVLLVL